MDRCALCPGVNMCIPDDGPDDAELLFIGEAPGKDEDRRARKSPPGKPFVGKTGEEVDRHYLPLANLRRERVRFANAIRCMPISSGGKLDPTRKADLALLESCATRHLYPSIERNPKLRVIVPLGSFANRAVTPEVDLELDHGMPVNTAWGLPAFPMYHPALGIHEPKKMLYIRTDWQRLRRYLAGKLELPHDIYSEQEDYAEATSDDIWGLDANIPLAADTESRKGGAPHCLTFSQHPGVGRLIRAERSDLLQLLQSRLDEWAAPILFHNWLYDWSVTDSLGLRLPYQFVVDTMSLVFHLGNLPQGLKALSKRELGMRMQDFDDLVRPYSQRLVMMYYEMALDHPWPKPEERLEVDSKTGLWKLKKPQSMNTRLKRFFTDYGKNAEKDVFGMWESNWVDDHAMIEQVFGPFPGLCISHVPFEKVLHYACRDVDALIRLYPLLKRMKAMVRHYTQDRWRIHAA